jgi:hypothetical protein
MPANEIKLHIPACAFDLKELFWAAGFLEGEGTFGDWAKNLRCSAVQVQREPLERLQRLFGGSIGFKRSRNPRHQDQFCWTVSGHRAAGVMMTAYVLMSLRRKAQIRKGLTIWKQRTQLLGANRVRCKRGHLMTAENTITYKVFRKGRKNPEAFVRRCKPCMTARLGRPCRRRDGITFRCGHARTPDNIKLMKQKWRKPFETCRTCLSAAQNRYVEKLAKNAVQI